MIGTRFGLAVLVLLFSDVAMAGPPTKPVEVVGGVEVTNLPDVQAVEVVNQPVVQDVRVINPPDPPPPVTCSLSRFQLAGFTTETYDGDMGGHFGVTRKCQLEFPDSRMCTLEEVAATTSIPSALAGEAWVHPAVAAFGSARQYTSVVLATPVGYVNNTIPNCFNWTYARSVGIGTPTGTIVGANGNSLSSANSNDQASCDEALPIACCAPVP